MTKHISHLPAPIFYADQPAEMMMGPITSKLTLGVVEADDSEFPRPVVTVVMPSTALLHLARDIVAQFEEPKFKQHAMRGLEAAGKAISSGGAIRFGAEIAKATKKIEEAPQVPKARRRVVTPK